VKQGKWGKDEIGKGKGSENGDWVTVEAVSGGVILRRNDEESAVR
jgi:hypothetical protein